MEAVILPILLNAHLSPDGYAPIAPPTPILGDPPTKDVIARFGDATGISGLFGGNSVLQTFRENPALLQNVEVGGNIVGISGGQQLAYGEAGKWISENLGIDLIHANLVIRDESGQAISSTT